MEWRRGFGQALLLFHTSCVFLLAVQLLHQHQFQVFPMENSQLADIAQRCAQARERASSSKFGGSSGGGYGSCMDRNARPSSSSSSPMPLQGRQWLRSTPTFASPLLQRSSSSSSTTTTSSSSSRKSNGHQMDSRNNSNSSGRGSGGGRSSHNAGRSEDYISANPLFPDLPSSSSSSSSAAAAGKSGSSKRSEGW